MMRLKSPAPSLILISVLVITLSSCSYNGAHSTSRIIERTETAMGTMITIKTSIGPGESEAAARDAMAKAILEIRRVESLFSVYLEDSQIAKINRSRPNEAVKIDPEVFGLIERSIGYSEDTGGAFDITVKPLVDLWRRVKDSKVLPEEKDVDEARSRVGWNKVVMDKGGMTISFRVSGMSMDMGGVAKGYATARAVKVLRDNGIRNAMVVSGGDIYCLGRRDTLERWIVGIQHPREPGNILYKINMENEAIDTSGDYQKYFIIGGRRYSHIIDPRTGHPIGDDITSATIIAKDPERADAYATALCILGKGGLDIINKKGLGCIVIHKNRDLMDVYLSKGLKIRDGIIEK